MASKNVYCPFCKSTKPLWKVGFQLRVAGKPSKQRFQCKNCRRITVNPLESPPRAKPVKARTKSRPRTPAKSKTRTKAPKGRKFGFEAAFGPRK